MAVRLITFDLNEPGRDDSAIINIVKSYGPWAKLAPSVYAVETSVSPENMMLRLKQYTDPYDIASIITLTTPYAVLGHDDVDDWLSRKL